MKKVLPMMLLMLFITVSAFFYAFQGVSMHNQVAVEEAKFHDLQSEYLLQAKSTRDGAAANSSLNQQHVEIANYPSELLRLKLVGVGKILTGIFILLFGILLALISMPVRLAIEIKK